QVALTFATPLDPAALARMVSLELRPLPGVDRASGRVLSPDDFEIKVVERKSRADAARYVLLLRDPIPLGTRTLLRLRLALDDRQDEAFREIVFSTAEPFRVVRVGCRASTFPVTREGTRYTREQAIACPPSPRTVVVEFSATPETIGPVAARNLVRLSPAVANLSFATEGRTLAISGDFARDTLYSVAVAPAEVRDERGRALDLRGRSEVFLHFRREAEFVRLSASHGFVERFGPQTIPIEGRGQERVDLRIHRVPPLDRSFWPFPDRPLVVDEKQRPPGPGEAPSRFDDPERPITADELKRQIATLGSPTVSTLVTLPLRRDGGSATFGLDLRPHLEKVAGKDAPGTYLVGLRDLAGDETRSWMWLQATDLTLSTAEEPHHVRFVVSSLSTGRPVAGARVRVEGVLLATKSSWEVFGEGETDAFGAFVWRAPGALGNISRAVRRIVVEKDGDTLVLDPARPPELYADNQWSVDRTSWLQWAVEPLVGRGPQPETLAHIFTERPVYRPEEEVHIKGYLRGREGGHLTPLSDFPGFVVVQGPGDLAWRYAVTTSPLGSFYHRFQEKDLPTGTFTAHFETTRGERLGQVAFRVEAYRVPRFEVRLHGPETASLDRPFEVSLTATYYAGGKVSGQPVAWRVTQFPYPWTPKKQPGFQYSSDARFSRGGRFQAS
ncbi:MAG TPA: MG2 domain-containing protein, partial [Vicinamibacteria bacterium]|nr:MG2 domain-containing protein [Vicinamibacteria bacterium]